MHIEFLGIQWWCLCLVVPLQSPNFQKMHHRMTGNSFTTKQGNWPIYEMGKFAITTGSKISQTRVRNHCFPLPNWEKTSSSAAQLLQVMQHPLQLAGEQHSPVQLQVKAFKKNSSGFFLSFSIPHTLEKVFDSSQIGFHVAVSQKKNPLNSQTSTWAAITRKNPQLISPNISAQGAHCVAVPLGMSKVGRRQRPAPPAGKPWGTREPTPSRLPPPFSRVQSIQNLQ